MCEVGDYGTVEVTAGHHKGKTGYYDDDSGDPGYAIVYFGVPFDSPYFYLRHSSLKRVDRPHLPLETFMRKHPVVAYMMGVSG